MYLNISNYAGLFHLFGMIIENIYGFIFTKHILLDKCYVISFVFIPFSWIICKDECIISYYIKKHENPNYILGNEPENVKDISDFFINNRVYNIFYNINHVLRIYSIIIVNNRTTRISYFIMNPTFILYSCYIYDITYKLDFRKKLYPYFQIILSSYFFTIFYKIISG
jgi:hypothetical protein